MEKIIDYVSGLEVNATPEEINAVQPFSKILVEDYGYPKNMIQTHPQYRVKSSPSDKRGYPIDIAVFEYDSKGNKKLKIVVENKKSTRKDGEDQLEDYLKFCAGFKNIDRFSQLGSKKYLPTESVYRNIWKLVNGIVKGDTNYEI